MARYGDLGPGLSNRDRARDAATRKMPQHGAGLKKIRLTAHRKVTRIRGGVRGNEDAFWTGTGKRGS